MSIQATVTMTIAEVEVNDDYGVTLHVRRTRTKLDPDDAIKLADELHETATEAKEKQLADQRQARAASHGFDTDKPAGATIHICRECLEGKHSACNGASPVEEGDDVVLYDCNCAHTEVVS